MAKDKKKEELVKEYNELTEKINELNNKRIKVVAVLEYIQEEEKENK